MKELLRQRLEAFRELVKEQDWDIRELPPIEGATKRTHFLITHGKDQARISFSREGGLYVQESGEDPLNATLLEWIRKTHPRARISPEARKREVAWLMRRASDEGEE